MAKDIALPNCNLYLTGKGLDPNGNYVVKLCFPNQRSFSIQTNGTLNKTQNILKDHKKISSITANELEDIEKEVVQYVSKYGSAKQRKTLHVYGDIDYASNIIIPTKKSKAAKKKSSDIEFETSYTEIKGEYSGKDSFGQEEIFVGITKEGSLFIVDIHNKERSGRDDFSMSGNTVRATTVESAKEQTRQSAEEVIEEEGLEAFGERVGQEFDNLEAAVDYTLSVDGETSFFDNSLLSDEIDVEGTDYIFGSEGAGQNDHEFDDLAVSFLDEKTLVKLKTLWKKYHLKELPAGESVPKIEQDRDMILENYIRRQSGLSYGKGGKVKEVISHNGNYLTISATKDKMTITLTPEGIEEIKELKADGKNDYEIMPRLFEDIQGNSELEYHPDLGETGFGLTSASGVTDGYYYDDDGEYTDKGHKDSRVYYFNDYALRSEIADLLNKGELVLTGADNKMAKGGVVPEEHIEELSKGYMSAVLFTDEDDNEEPLDRNYSTDDFEPKTVATIKTMAKKFITDNKKAIEESGLSYDQIGMDMWYAQQGHGVGFRDRGIDKALAEKLIKGAKAFGDLSANSFAQDGKVYIEGIHLDGKGKRMGTGGEIINGVKGVMVNGDAIDYHELEKVESGSPFGGEYFVKGEYGYAQSGYGWFKFKIKDGKGKRMGTGGGVGYEKFKAGEKVNVSEAYLNDEASGGNATATATIMSEPSDEEELVQIQYENGSIDYLGQEWLEPIGSMGTGKKGNSRVKTIAAGDCDKYNLSNFPNFSKTGSIRGMKEKYYGKDALLVRCGNYIYNVTSAPEIYNIHAYETGGKVGGRGWGMFNAGEKIKSLDEMKRGDIVLEHNNQFNANNVIRIIQGKDEDALKRDIAYAKIIDGYHPEKNAIGAKDDGFAIWDFQFADNEYFFPKEKMGTGGKIPYSGVEAGNKTKEERESTYHHIDLDKAKSIIRDLTWDDAADSDKFSGYYPENVFANIGKDKFRATYSFDGKITLITRDGIFIIPATEKEYDELISDKMGAGGSVKTNDDAIISFLESDKEVRANHVTTHFNQYDNEVLLRQYGTLLATRKGRTVKMLDKKFSVTTSTLQNKLKKEAANRGFDLQMVKEFAEGGLVGKSSNGFTGNSILKSIFGM